MEQPNGFEEPTGNESPSTRHQCYTCLNYFNADEPFFIGNEVFCSIECAAQYYFSYMRPIHDTEFLGESFNPPDENTNPPTTDDKPPVVDFVDDENISREEQE